MFKGSFVALVTPFKNGAVDLDCAQETRRLADRRGHARACARRARPGESPTLSHEEHEPGHRGRRRGRRRPRAGDRGRRLQQHRRGDRADPARRGRRRRCGAGGDALLQQADPARPDRPFHGDARRLRPADHHLQHPAALGHRHDARDDGRAGEAADASSASRTRPARSSRVCQQRAACGKDFIQLSGEDATALGFNAHGGVGCISVTANVAPKLCAEFQEATLARRLRHGARLSGPADAAARGDLHRTGRLPARNTRLSLLGLCSEEVRSPLTTLLPETKAKIDAAMRHAGLVN